MGLRTERFRVDANGVVMTRLINKTGAASVLGTAVESDTTTDLAVKPCGAPCTEPIGAIAENGIADGSLVWVGRAGPVQFLLEDTTGATHGNWAKTSDTVDGRIDATNAAPPGGGIPELDEHVREVGHVAETKSGGTDVLCRINCHFL
jgi:hypothetical protein